MPHIRPYLLPSTVFIQIPQNHRFLNGIFLKLPLSSRYFRHLLKLFGIFTVETILIKSITQLIATCVKCPLKKRVITASIIFSSDNSVDASVSINSFSVLFFFLAQLK